MRYLPLFLAFLLGPGVCLVRAAAPERPNIILFFADDQGYGDVGCYNPQAPATPFIDRLASQGMRFTSFYSAYCVCSASRASLMTGSYQPRVSMPGVLGPKARIALHPDEVTIADLLRTRGYATMAIGKWHLGDHPETLPTAQGFQSYFGYPYSNDMARKKGFGNGPQDLDQIWRNKQWQAYEGVLYRDEQVIEQPVKQTTLTDRYADEAVRFIHENAHQPFFLYLAHSMPHVPLFVSEDRYQPDPQQAYRLTIQHIDATVGRILDTLDRLALSENTLILYTSDNGPWLSKQHHGGSAGPLRAGKTTTYEGGMRVPCVVRWPGHIPAGVVQAGVAGTIDVLPTLAAITGARLPADRPIDGLNILPMLQDPSAPSPHDQVGLFYYRNNQPEAVRLGPWKLRRALPGKNGKPGPLELYHLDQDIGETENLAGKEPDQVQQMMDLMERYDARLQAEVRPPWKASDR